MSAASTGSFMTACGTTTGLLHRAETPDMIRHACTHPCDLLKWLGTGPHFLFCALQLTPVVSHALNHTWVMGHMKCCSSSDSASSGSGTPGGSCRHTCGCCSSQAASFASVLSRSC